MLVGLARCVGLVLEVQAGQGVPWEVLQRQQERQVVHRRTTKTRPHRKVVSLPRQVQQPRQSVLMLQASQVMEAR